MLIRDLYEDDLDNNFSETLRSLREVDLSLNDMTKVFYARVKQGVHTYVAIFDERLLGQ